MDVPFCAGGYGGKYRVSNKNFFRKIPQEDTFYAVIASSLHDSLFYSLPGIRLFSIISSPQPAISGYSRPMRRSRRRDGSRRKGWHDQRRIPWLLFNGCLSPLFRPVQRLAHFLASTTREERPIHAGNAPAVRVLEAVHRAEMHSPV